MPVANGAMADRVMMVICTRCLWMVSRCHSVWGSEVLEPLCFRERWGVLGRRMGEYRAGPGQNGVLGGHVVWVGGCWVGLGGGGWKEKLISLVKYQWCILWGECHRVPRVLVCTGGE
jgi:hypothetical protein